MSRSRGIDVSAWQDNQTTVKEIDWTKPKTGGVRFVINRAVFSTTIDRIFLDSMRDQKEQGYIRSAYGFIDYRYDNIEEQATAFANAILAAGGVDMPYVFADFEKAGEGWPNLPPRAKSLDILFRYISTVERLTGLICGLYTNQSCIRYTLMQDGLSTVPVPDWLKQRPLWIADPVIPSGSITPESYIETTGRVPNFYNQWETWTFWQYSWKGPGIEYGMESYGLDMNYFNGTDADLEYVCLGISPSEPQGENMWESNALIVAFEKTASYPEAKTIDFVRLKALGVHAVILRCGTSTGTLNYDQPDAGYINDTDFGRLFQAATAAGLRVLIDYDFNAMLDSVNAYDGSVTKRHINQLISGGLKPVSGGALLLNVERNTWYEGSRLVTCMANMFAQDLQNVSDSLWGSHKLVPGVRTGKWFTASKDSTGATYESQMIFMDQGEANYPIFFARPKKTNIIVNTDFHSIIADIPDPHITYVKDLQGSESLVEEQAYYLYYGNQTKWSGWEIAWIKNDAVRDLSNNLAIFRLILWNGTPAQFDSYFNFPSTTVEPSSSTSPSVSPSPSAPPPVGNYDDKFAALKAGFTNLADLLTQVVSELRDLANKM